MARSESRAALIEFRIRHSEKMSGVNADKQFKINLFRGNFVSKLCEKFLKIATCRINGNTERITDSLENPVLLLRQIRQIKKNQARKKSASVKRHCVAMSTFFRATGDGGASSPSAAKLTCCKRQDVAQLSQFREKKLSQSAEVDTDTEGETPTFLDITPFSNYNTLHNMKRRVNRLITFFYLYVTSAIL